MTCRGDGASQSGAHERCHGHNTLGANKLIVGSGDIPAHLLVAMAEQPCGSPKGPLLARSATHCHALTPT